MNKFLLFLFVIFCENSEASSYGSCVDGNGKEGECIFLNECSALAELFNNKPIPHEIRKFLSKSQCGYHNGMVLVCCAPDDAPIAPPHKSQSPSNELPQPGECGFSIQDKIFGGMKTKITDFPWMARLQYTKPGGGKSFHCGGSLINQQYVLTAAHCKEAIPAGWNLTGVRLGEWNIRTDEDCDDSNLGEPAICSPPHKDIDVSEIIVHEDYVFKSKAMYHDIALLRLKEKVTFTKFISSICLPVHANLQNKDHTGESMEVSGWGKTENSSSSDFKLKVNIDGVSLEDCNEVYKSNHVTLQDGQICAGGIRGQDSCNGDSGGPLMAVDDLTNASFPYFYMVGLVSFGPAWCGQEGWPGVYTDISRYTDWIESKLKA